MAVLQHTIQRSRRGRGERSIHRSNDREVCWSSPKSAESPGFGRRRGDSGRFLAPDRHRRVHAERHDDQTPSERLGRWLGNEKVDPRSIAKAVWFKTGARRVRGWRVVAVDWTMNEDYWVLMAAVCLRGRAVPVMWKVIPAHCVGFSQNAIEDDFSTISRRRWHARGRWVVVADRGFRRADLIERLDYAGISFVIRIMDDVWVKARGIRGNFGTGAFRAGTVALNRDVAFRQKNPVPSPPGGLAQGEREAVVLVSGDEPLEGGRRAESADSTRAGFGWRSSFGISSRDSTSEPHASTDPRKIERILLVAALLLLILFAVGTCVGTGMGRGERSTRKGQRGSWSIVLLGFATYERLPVGSEYSRLRPLWPPQTAAWNWGRSALPAPAMRSICHLEVFGRKLGVPPGSEANPRSCQ